MLFVRHV
jgi:hypothetical protein